MLRKFFTVTLAAIAMAAPAVAQNVPNGSFEEWTTTLGVSIPKGWFTSSVMDPFASKKPVVRVTDSHDGDYALKLETSVMDMGDGEMDTVAGTAFTGKFDFSGPAIGFPYSERPQKLSFYYKYSPAATDSFMVSVVLMKYDDSMGMQAPVATALFFGGAAMDYTKGEAALVYESEETPDTAIVSIFSSVGDVVNLGSVLHIDKVEFESGSTTGMDEQTGNIEVSGAYPNPTDGRVNIPVSLKKASRLKLELFDMQGRLLYQQQEMQPAGNNLLPLDLGSCEKGIYMYRISNDDEYRTGRISLR